jgi:hypothetical protein
MFQICEVLQLMSAKNYKRPERSVNVGARNPNAKITRRTALILRELHADGWSYAMLTEVCGLSKSGVARVIRGEVWR